MVKPNLSLLGLRYSPLYIDAYIACPLTIDQMEKLILACTLLSACASDPCTDNRSLSEIARTSVKEHLKAPSTAQFSDETVKENHQKDGKLVHGKVVSQNSLGALLTVEYNVVVKCENGTPVVTYGGIPGATWGRDFERSVDSLNNNTPH